MTRGRWRQGQGAHLSRADQIECGDSDVWNHLPVERQREFDPVAMDHRSRGLVDAVGVAF